MPRPSLHQEHRLHPWVFIQSRVWVDTHGAEHVIADMPDDYVANVIGFCRREARYIRRLVSGYDMSELWRALSTGGYDDERDLDIASLASGDLVDALDWLDATPLLEALKERLGNPSEDELRALQEAAREAHDANEANDAQPA